MVAPHLPTHKSRAGDFGRTAYTREFPVGFRLGSDEHVEQSHCCLGDGREPLGKVIAHGNRSWEPAVSQGETLRVRGLL